MKKLIGTFYFKQTIYGNLIGEFTNNTSEEILTETASLEGKNKDFEGTYNSIWFDVELHQSTLSITKKLNKYLLKWTESGKSQYEGEGILVDSILIGFYKMI